MLKASTEQMASTGQGASTVLCEVVGPLKIVSLQSGVELELIERLKKKQVEQQQALQELQEAMALTSRSALPTLALVCLHCNHLSAAWLPAFAQHKCMPRSFTQRASRSEDVV